MYNAASGEIQHGGVRHLKFSAKPYVSGGLRDQVEILHSA